MTFFYRDPDIDKYISNRQGEELDVCYADETEINDGELTRHDQEQCEETCHNNLTDSSHKPTKIEDTGN